MAYGYACRGLWRPQEGFQLPCESDNRSCYRIELIVDVRLLCLNGCRVGSSDFDIFLEIQYASCVFGLALKSKD